MNGYRVLFSSAIWRAIWVAIWRAPRDPYARKNLIRILFSLLPLLVCIGCYAFFIHSALKDDAGGNLIAMGCGVGMTVILTVIISYRQRREDRKFDRDYPAVGAEVKLRIYRETCLLATLLERLGSEFEMEKELPPNLTVITRRVLLDRLTELNLRDTLEPWLLDILLPPDGHWPAELKARARPAWECFAVLRWVNGLDELRDLTLQPKHDISDTRAVIDLKNPEKLKTLPSWDIRPARDHAERFLGRCWAELSARRELRHMSEEEISKAIEARESIQSKGYTEDYVVGTKTVAELPTPTLWFLTVRSYNRWRTLSLLVDITSNEKPATDLRKLFAEFFAPGVDGAEEEVVRNSRAN